MKMCSGSSGPRKRMVTPSAARSRSSSRAVEPASLWLPAGPPLRVARSCAARTSVPPSRPGARGHRGLRAPPRPRRSSASAIFGQSPTARRASSTSARGTSVP